MEMTLMSLMPFLKWMGEGNGCPFCLLCVNPSHIERQWQNSLIFRVRREKVGFIEIKS
jgi:hypothetical protein